MYTVRCETCTVTGVKSTSWRVRTQKGCDLAGLLAAALVDLDQQVLEEISQGQLLVEHVCIRMRVDPAVPRKRLGECWHEALGMIAQTVTILPETGLESQQGPFAGLPSGEEPQRTVEASKSLKGSVIVEQAKGVPYGKS